VPKPKGDRGVPSENDSLTDFSDNARNDSAVALFATVDELRHIFREELHEFMSTMSERIVVDHGHDHRHLGHGGGHHKEPEALPGALGKHVPVKDAPEPFLAGPATAAANMMPSSYFEATGEKVDVADNEASRERSPSPQRGTKKLAKSSTVDSMFHANPETPDYPMTPAEEQHYTAKRKKSASDVLGHDQYVMYIMGTHAGKWIEWLYDIKEPKREGLLARFVLNTWFEAAVAMVILSNAMFQVYITNYKIQNVGEPLPESSRTVEIMFLLAYTVELVAKLIVHKLYFFWNEEMSWNIFDFFLVLISVYDLVGDTSIIAAPDVTYLRIVRFMKLGKLLRIVRLVKLVRELRLILNSMRGSLTSFFWSMVMLLIVFFMFGTLFVEAIEGCLREGCEGMQPASREVVAENFNSVQQAMVTMFKAVTGGDDWGQFYTALEPVGNSYAMLYLFFIAFCNFAFMNILTGIFMENAMTLAKPDRETMAFEHHKEELHQIEALSEIFMEMDKDGSGKMAKQEFLRVIHTNEQVKAFFAQQGLDIKDAEMFFKMLKDADHEDEDVEIDVFVDGCMRMKGLASSLDVQALRFRLRNMRRENNNHYKELSHKLQAVQGVELDIEQKIDGLDTPLVL
jgi:hypothetical protein